MSIKEVQKNSEILACSQLIHAFMNSTKNDYTEMDLYNMLPGLLRNGRMFYVEVNEVPRAYCILVNTVMIDKPAALLFQVYAPVHKHSEMLYEHVRKFLQEKGIDRVIALVDPDNMLYFYENYNMQLKQVLMQWDMTPTTLREMRDKQIDLEVSGNGKKEQGQEGEEGGPIQEEGEEVESEVE